MAKRATGKGNGASGNGAREQAGQPQKQPAEPV